MVPKAIRFVVAGAVPGNPGGTDPGAPPENPGGNLPAGPGGGKELDDCMELWRREEPAVFP
jgi:hypothetical protein